MEVAREGKVVEVARRSENHTWYVKIKVNNTMYQTYIGFKHRPKVFVGQIVEKGEIIGD